MSIEFGFSLTGRGPLADRETLTTLAQRAEALGYDSVFVTDRMLIPVARTAAYPYSATGAFPLGPDEPWLEALTAVTYLATVTRRIRAARACWSFRTATPSSRPGRWPPPTTCPAGA
jgi:alkanesulfonate monooxygenase SsuD/methylene tetrahydromethanopterin reductase-like flavin-dependent oxidoreductase (luciferase family)